MRRVTKSTFGLAVIIAAIFISGVSYAQVADDAKQGMEKKMEARMDKMVKDLGLSSEQQEQLKAQHAANREKMRSQRELMQAKRQELKSEIEKQTVDRAKIDGIIAEIKTLMGEELTGRVDMLLATKQILTSAQFAKLQEKQREGFKKGDKKRKGNKGEFNREMHEGDQCGPGGL